jgi:hypothetical protein
MYTVVEACTNNKNQDEMMTSKYLRVISVERECTVVF